MYSNARHIVSTSIAAWGIAVVALLLSCSPVKAQGVSVLNARWEGNDYVIRFSDTLGYTVDLGASDSMLVLYFSRPIAATEGEAEGPNNVFASFSRNAGDSMVVLTVRGKNRVEYSTLWRPYSHRLIVHTFNSNDLESNYAANQYHLGLLALEQKLPDQARSYLSGARASDNGDIARRAASILGVMYAQEGQDSLARIYLTAPYDADDYMARAELNRRAGDMEAAEKDEEMFKEKIAEMDEKMGEFVEGPQPIPVGNEPADAEGSDRPPIAKIFDDWRGIVLVGIAALLIIALAVWFSRRPSAPQQHELHRPDYRHDHPRTEPTAPPPTVPAERSPAPPPPAPPTPPAKPAAATPEPTRPAAVTPEPAKPAAESVAPPEPVQAQPSREVAEIKKEERIAEVSTTTTAVVQPVRESQPKTVSQEIPVHSETRTDAPEIAERKERRGSAQADQLRQRMEAARGETSQAASAKPATPSQAVENESILTEARRLNVSRDYVELRNRIAELRKRIEEN